MNRSFISVRTRSCAPRRTESHRGRATGVAHVGLRATHAPRDHVRARVDERLVQFERGARASASRRCRANAKNENASRLAAAAIATLRAALSIPIATHAYAPGHRESVASMRADTPRKTRCKAWRRIRQAIRQRGASRRPIRNAAASHPRERSKTPAIHHVSCARCDVREATTVASTAHSAKSPDGSRKAVRGLRTYFCKAF